MKSNNYGHNIHYDDKKHMIAYSDTYLYKWCYHYMKSLTIDENKCIEWDKW
jgi:hypothetical protein